MREKTVYVTSDGVVHDSIDKAHLHSLDKATVILRDLLAEANIDAPFDTAKKIIHSTAMYEEQLRRLRLVLHYRDDATSPDS